MSPVKKPNAIQNDYGRRPEMKGGKGSPGWKGYLQGGGKGGSYRELMGRATDQAILDKLVEEYKKHSEWKKPYYDDEFPEMEHFFYGPVRFPGLEWNISGPPFSECWDVCKKNHSGAYFDDSCYLYIWLDVSLYLTNEKALIDNNYLIEMVRIADAPINNIVRQIYRSPEPIETNSTVAWHVYQPLFEACPGVDDRIANSCQKTYYSSLTCAECPVDPAMTWDYDTSAETIDPGDPGDTNSVTIAVQDGKGPYSWSVVGTGYTLASATTSAVTNTLIADEDACGSAVITVTDACDTTVNAAVRSTDPGSSWCQIYNCNPYVPNGNTYCTVTQDQYYWDVTWWCSPDPGVLPDYHPCGLDVPCVVPSGIYEIQCTGGTYPCYFVTAECGGWEPDYAYHRVRQFEWKCSC